VTEKFQNDIKNLVEEFNFNGHKKFKLIVLFGLLGDFDTFEYAINLVNFINNHQDRNLEIFAIAIGNQNGKEKFCKFDSEIIFTELLYPNPGESILSPEISFHPDTIISTSKSHE